MTLSFIRIRSLAPLVTAGFLLALSAGCDRGASPAPKSGSGGSVSTNQPAVPPTAAVPSLPAPETKNLAPPSVPDPGTNMVRIKAGSFVRLRRTVTLTQDFWLGAREVTQGEYERVMGRNPSFFTGKPDAPVEKVSHADALAYCAALTRQERDAGRLSTGYEYRLPFEAEWEYACRAGTTNLFSFGDATTRAGEYAWTWENSGETTHPVGQKLPNPWGLYDMHGNVWEWCMDWFGDYPQTDVTDPVGPSQGKIKVFRGGGWNNEVQYARSANRFTMKPGSGIHFVGFRVALAPVRRL